MLAEKQDMEQRLREVQEKNLSLHEENVNFKSVADMAQLTKSTLEQQNVELSKKVNYFRS